MLAIPGYLQTAFGAKAVKNSELSVLWMMANKRLLVQGARPHIGLMVYQCYVSQMRRDLGECF